MFLAKKITFQFPNASKPLKHGRTETQKKRRGYEIPFRASLFPCLRGYSSFGIAS